MTLDSSQVHLFSSTDDFLLIYSVHSSSYHVLATDKIKVAREKAAKEQEIKAAYEKYQPFQQPKPINEVVEIIRSQSKVRHYIRG